MKLKTVQEVREEFPKLTEGLTNDEIADDIISERNEINLNYNAAPVDYYLSLKQINPDSQFVNVENYKKTLDPNTVDDKNNLQHARDAYDKLTKFHKTRIEFPDFANEFAPRTVRSLKDDVAMPSPYTKKELLEVRGIVTEPEYTSRKGRLAGSFAMDDENKILALEKYAANYFQQPIKIVKDELTGDLLFRNPKTNQMQVVNKVGFDIGDLASVTGDAAVSLAEFGASVAGAFVGPKASISAGAGAAQLTDMARLLVGQKLFGINQNLNTLEDFAKEAAGTGLTSLVFGTAGEYGMRGIAAIQKNLGKGSIKPEDLEGFVANAAEKRALADKINKKLEEAGIKDRLKLSVAKATDDPELQAHFGALERDGTKGKKALMKGFNEGNARALAAYYNLIRDGFTSKNLLDKSYQGQRKSLQKMYNFILDDNTAEHKVLMKKLSQSKDDLTNEVINLPQGNIKEGGKTVRNSVQKLYDLRKKNFDKKYDLLFDATEGQRSINTNVIAKTIKSIDDEKKETLFAMYPDLNNIIKLTDDKGQPIKDISLRTAHNTVSQLLRHNRNLQKGNITTENPPDQKIINRIIKSFNQQMQEDLGADDRWLGIYMRLQNDFRDNKQQYAKLLGKLIDKDQGRLKIADEDVFDTSFKKDSPGQEERIDDIMSVLKTDSDSLNVFKKNILEFYTDQVDPLRTGDISVEAHKMFMKDYNYSLKTVFGEQGAKDIEKVGVLNQKLKDLEELEKTTVENLKKTTAGQIAERDAEQLFGFVFKGGDFGGAEAKKLEDVMKILKKDPELKKEFQTVATNKMLFDTTERNGFQFVPGALSKFLKKNETNLRIVFEDNPEYIKNILEFEDIVNTIQKTTRDKPTEKLKGPLNDILRTRVGMFTTAGRTMTAGLKLARQVMDERMYRFLTDPEALDKLVKFSKKPQKFWETEKGRAIVTDLFGTIPYMMGIYSEGVSPDSSMEEVDIPSQKEVFFELGPQSAAPSPTVDMFAMEQAPRPTEPAPVTPPPVEQPQPAGIAALPADRGQTYAGLFPNDPSGQMIAQRGNQNART